MEWKQSGYSVWISVCPLFIVTAVIIRISTYSIPLSSLHYHGNFSIMAIGSEPCGSSFSLLRKKSQHGHTTHIYAPHTHPPYHQAIYREVTTPVNDGNAELKPINAANMTNSTPNLHLHTSMQ